MPDVPATLTAELRDLERHGGVDLLERIDLREWTALRLGGVADLMIRCTKVNAVSRTLDALASHGIGWLVLGAGTRLIPPDRGLRVPVITLSGDLARWEIDLDGVVVGGGAKLAQLASSVARSGLSGLEGSSIVGTVGGACVAALADRQPTALETVDWVEAIRPGAPIRRWSCRTGGILRGPMARHVIVAARLTLRPDRPAAIRARLADYAGRRATIREEATGRLFHTPDGVPAGKLVESAGCRGLAVGGARLSELKPDHIVLSRTATTEDVRRLLGELQRRTGERCGVALRPAVVLVNELGRAVDG